MIECLEVLLACIYSFGEKSKLQRLLASAETDKIRLKRERDEWFDKSVALTAQALAWKKSAEEWQAHATNLTVALAQTKEALRLSTFFSSMIPLQQSNNLDPALVEDLIKLCHPDKHPNNERATEVTKKLLTLRSKGKKK